MFDFHFGSREEIESNPEAFLIFLKHLMPRWSNGIPDAEALAIYRATQQVSAGKGLMIETGSGASTLALVLGAIFSNSRVITWDTNANKGSFLRSVMTEGIGLSLDVDINKYWTFVGLSSLDPHGGIGLVREMGHLIKFGFFDSWHTRDHLTAEVLAALANAGDQAIFAIDDAYYDNAQANYAFVNLTRKKLKLPPIEEPPNNRGIRFDAAVQSLLSERYAAVERLQPLDSRTIQVDIHSVYFATDRRVFASVGMEDEAGGSERFAAWLCSHLKA